MKHLINFFKDEEGVTAIEYGLIAALVIIVAVGAVTTAGGNLSSLWTSIGTNVKPKTGG